MRQRLVTGLLIVGALLSAGRAAAEPLAEKYLRKVFEEPRSFDPILWFQGTAATPYLEEGEITKLADPGMLERINKAFGGGPRFAGFAFWFN